MPKFEIPTLLQIYHRLPMPLRSLAASMRGYYLAAWRYGAGMEEEVERTLAREYWSEADWQAWRTEQLGRLLQRAATRVPYYREFWQRQRRHGRRASWEYLENWPVLKKESLRKNPIAFLADDCNPRRMFHEHTSGTTGKSLDLYWSRKTVQTYYAWVEARWRRWYGVSRRDRWAILGGQLVAPARQERPPFWVWNQGLNQLYMSSYHLRPDLLPEYLNALRRYAVRYIWGYTSSLYALALAVRQNTVEDLNLAVVVSNAEPVFDYQRDIIQSAFGCPLRETYGMAEIVSAASECSHGKLHLWPEMGMIEEAPADGSAADLGSSLICTGLLNWDMPLIRYEVGDRGRLGAQHQECGCGRTLPVIETIEGRLDDVLYTPDGRSIGRLDPVFKTRLPVLEAQIIQETLGKLRLIIVPAKEYSDAAGQSIVSRLRDRMGPVEVDLEIVSQIPRDANGKFRAVISNLSAAEAGRLGIPSAIGEQFETGR